MNPTEQPRRSFLRKASLAIAGTATAACVFGGVYFWATRQAGPEFPTTTVTEAEAQEALAEIERSLTDLRTGPAVSRFTDQLEALNLAELKADADAGTDPAKEDKQLSDLRTAARIMAHENPEGYRMLGKKLSLEFMDLMESLLKDATASGGISSALKKDKARADRIDRLGGTFLRRAMSKGIIENSGRLQVSPLAMQVMFQARWNYLAGLAPDDGLGPAARKVFFDWTVRFSEPANLNKRLVAIGLLKVQDSQYDDVLARAIVLHQAGRDADALQTLKDAIAQGRKDEPTLSFARSLSPR